MRKKVGRESRERREGGGREGREKGRGKGECDLGPREVIVCGARSQV